MTWIELIYITSHDEVVVMISHICQMNFISEQMKTCERLELWFSLSFITSVVMWKHEEKSSSTWNLHTQSSWRFSRSFNSSWDFSSSFEWEIKGQLTSWEILGVEKRIWNHLSNTAPTWNLNQVSSTKNTPFSLSSSRSMLSVILLLKSLSKLSYLLSSEMS